MMHSPRTSKPSLWSSDSGAHTGTPQHSPRGRAGTPTHSHHQPSSSSRQHNDPMQWFTDPTVSNSGYGSPFAKTLTRADNSPHMRSAQPQQYQYGGGGGGTSSGAASPRGNTPIRTYASLNRTYSPGTSSRLSRANSPTVSTRKGTVTTPSKTTTPGPQQQRAQTPRQHVTAAPSYGGSTPIPTTRAKTPTRLHAPSFLSSAEKAPHGTQRMDFYSSPTHANSPLFSRLYSRQSSLGASNNTPSSSHPRHHHHGSSNAPPTPTNKSVDSFTSAGGMTESSLESFMHMDLSNGSFSRTNTATTNSSGGAVPPPPPAPPINTSFASRNGTPVRSVLQREGGSDSTATSPRPLMTQQQQRSAAPTLASLHTPKSVVPTPSTPSLFLRRSDSDIFSAGSPVAASPNNSQSPSPLFPSTPRSSGASKPQTPKQTLRNYVGTWNNKYKENSRCYREGGYLTVNKGDVLNDRYQMLHKLGWGEFSTVWLARDRKPSNPHQTFVAVKVAKCHPSVTNSTNYEINLLKYVCDSPKVTGPVTRLLDSFEHQGQYGTHVCMVMPVMGSNLLCIVDQMKAKRRLRSEREVAMLRDVTAAMLRGLDSLEAINVVHTDIKPENVLAAVPDPKMVKLAAGCVDLSNPADEEALKNFEQGDLNGPLVAVADFGLSFLLEQHGQLPPGAEKVGIKKDLDVQYPGIANNRKGILIQTREYRAPEVLFGGTICARSDVWSVGCMVYELITGDFLLDPKKKTSNDREMDIEHVAMIMRILGPVPQHIAKASQNPAKHLSRYFDSEGRFLYSERYKNIPRRSIASELEAFLEPSEAERAAQFIMSCFSYDPLERCHARDLLGHSWLRSTRQQQQ